MRQAAAMTLRRARRRRALVVAALTALLAALLAGAAPIPGGEAQARPVDAAQRFLARYAAQDGRVIRHDQGRDTVSEGQAYAMLFSVAIGDRRRFAASWNWARTRLQRPDGLLSYLWRDGRVADPQSATDADLDAARALVLAGRRFGKPAYRAAGLRIARAMASIETVRAGGRLVLVAGPWARRAPFVFNPSYISPAALDVLGAASGDPRFLALRSSGVRTIAALQHERTGLPPGWARVQPNGAATPTTGASDGGPGLYDFDAVRVPLRLAGGCDSASDAAAARMWPFLRSQVRTGLASTYTLAGAPRGGSHPAALVGAAGAAHAAGDAAARDALLARAERLDRAQPSYYGSALIALARVELGPNLLDRCAVGER